MRKLVFLLTLTLLSVRVTAQMSRILGNVASGLNNAVYLFEIEDGAPKLIKSSRPSNDGTFSFSVIPPYEGFYLIGGFTALAGQFPIYLKKEDSLTLQIEKNFLQFLGPTTAENRVLASWEKMKQVSSSASTLAAKDIDAFLKNIATKNNRFNQLMKSYVAYEVDYSRLLYLKRNPDMVIEKSANPYKNLIIKDIFKDDVVLSYPYGKELITFYADYAANLNKAADGLNFLSTDRQKGIYIFDRLKSKLQSYRQFEEMTNKYGKYFQHPILKAKVDAMGAKLYNATPGRKGSNFSFPDKDGKMVSLSDFKGKVVLVDVWATFCGPCKELIPALNKLEAELHDQKDLVFIGVAQDGPRAKDTWLKIIKDKQMGGIQLFAGGGNNVLANDYKIKVMPRYLIFDRLGNVVTAEAPLPGNPTLKKMLLAELAK